MIMSNFALNFIPKTNEIIPVSILHFIIFITSQILLMTYGRGFLTTTFQ